MFHLIFFLTTVTLLTSLPLNEKNDNSNFELSTFDTKIISNSNNVIEKVNISDKLSKDEKLNDKNGLTDKVLPSKIINLLKTIPANNFFSDESDKNEKKNIEVVNNNDLENLVSNEKILKNKNIDLEKTSFIYENLTSSSLLTTPIKDMNSINLYNSTTNPNSLFSEKKNFNSFITENPSSDFSLNVKTNSDIIFLLNKNITSFETILSTEKNEFKELDSRNTVDELNKNSISIKTKLQTTDKNDFGFNNSVLITENAITNYSLVENLIESVTSQDSLVFKNNSENNDISIQKSKLVSDNQNFNLNKSENYQSNSSEHLRENSTNEKFFQHQKLEAKSLENFELKNIIEDQSFLNTSIDENEILKTNSSSKDITSETQNNLLNDKINQTLEKKILNNKDLDEEPSYVINQKKFYKEKLDTARKEISLDNEDYVDDNIDAKLIKDKKQYYNGRNLIHNKQQNNFLINYLSSICVAAFGFIIGILIGLILFSSN